MPYRPIFLKSTFSWSRTSPPPDRQNTRRTGSRIGDTLETNTRTDETARNQWGLLPPAICFDPFCVFFFLVGQARPASRFGWLSLARWLPWTRTSMGAASALAEIPTVQGLPIACPLVPCWVPRAGRGCCSCSHTWCVVPAQNRAEKESGPALRRLHVHPAETREREDGTRNGGRVRG